MPNSATPSPGGADGVPPEAVTDAVAAEVAELHRIGVTRAQAVDSLHTVANDLIQHLITPTPGPAQRNALTCADALRAAATVLADHDDAPTSWSPTELQHDYPPPRCPPSPPPSPPCRRLPPTHGTHPRRRSTHPVSTCQNTCAHLSHRNTPTAPSHRPRTLPAIT